MQRRNFLKNIVGLLAAKQIAAELAKSKAATPLVYEPKHLIKMVNISKDLERALMAGDMGKNSEKFDGLLRVESLENTLKNVTWSDDDIKIWKAV